MAVEVCGRQCMAGAVQLLLQGEERKGRAGVAVAEAVEVCGRQCMAGAVQVLLQGRGRKGRGGQELSGNVTTKMQGGGEVLQARVQHNW